VEKFHRKISFQGVLYIGTLKVKKITISTLTINI